MLGLLPFHLTKLQTCACFSNQSSNLLRVNCAQQRTELALGKMHCRCPCLNSELNSCGMRIKHVRFIGISLSTITSKKAIQACPSAKLYFLSGTWHAEPKSILDTETITFSLQRRRIMDWTHLDKATCWLQRNPYWFSSSTDLY